MSFPHFCPHLAACGSVSYILVGIILIAESIDPINFNAAIKLER